MTSKIFRPADPIRLSVATALLATLTGCVVEPASQHSGYRGRPAVQVQAVVVYQDDYDYFPGYETYYSRNRREYVYREGSAWVRRPEPRDVAVHVLVAAPSVRVDFHDSPEQHHSRVVKSYPRNWTPPGKAKGRDDKDDDKDEKKKDKKDDDKRN